METEEFGDKGRRLVTVRQLAGLPGYRCFSEAALRHLVFSAQARYGSNGHLIPGNGLQESGAILRIGRKVLIDLDAFDAWLDEHR